MPPPFVLISILDREVVWSRWFYCHLYTFLDIMPLDIMSDDQGAPRQKILKIVGHVRSERRISGSLIY